MWFGVLGPLAIRNSERMCVPSAAKLRALLALLLAQPGEVVSTRRLITDLWDDEPPATANTALQVYVHQARRLLLPGRSGKDAEQPLKSVSTGYYLDLNGHECDAIIFERLAQQGVQQLDRGDAESAAITLRSALEQWRGPAFADVSVRSIQQVYAAELQRCRDAVLVCRIDAELRLQRHADLVPELTMLVAANPLDERFAAQLMTALAGSGRQVDALELYRDIRQQLRVHARSEPSPRLRRLQQAILSQDLNRHGPQIAVVRGATSQQSKLPQDIPDFTGRQDVLANLRETLIGKDDRSCSRVVLVSGLTGVGKTALVVHAAHQLVPHFRDGQLFVDLRGYDQRPVNPGDVLEGWLLALGKDRRDIPDELEGRSRLFRTATAGRRMLIILDNAVDESQVRSLLPSGVGCGTVITSRNMLAGLEGVGRINLRVPERAEALSMFAGMAGAGRVVAEPEAADSIVTACGSLPLAMRIAATHLAAHPTSSLGEFAHHLEVSADRLGELTAGGLQIKAKFAASYAACSVLERRAFRRLSLLPASPFPSSAVAVAVDIDQRLAERLIESLMEMHLLSAAREDGSGQVHYHLHDLLRLYAEERLAAEESVEECQRVVARIASQCGTFSPGPQQTDALAGTAKRAS